MLLNSHHGEDRRDTGMCRGGCFPYSRLCTRAQHSSAAHGEDPARRVRAGGLGLWLAGVCPELAGRWLGRKEAPCIPL